MSELNAPDDLEALFDQISDQRLAEIMTDNKAPETPKSATTQTAEEAHPLNGAEASHPSEVSPGNGEPYDIFQRVGSLTRRLHDALRELGYDKKVENAVNSLPDARARLSYIAKMTEQAADRALSAVERGQAELSNAQGKNERILNSWEKLFAKQLSLEDFKQLAIATQAHLKQMDQHLKAANSQFIEVMMAQDFQDLTGQVIQKIATLAQTLEEQLVQLLLDTTPPDRRGEATSGWMNGPVINGEGRSDVVTNQAQVDDLLESLGF